MRIQNLSLHYQLPKQKKKIIFNRLNFDFPNLGMIAITGDSGVGKSSLLKVIAKIIQPQKGKVILPPFSKLFPPLYLSDQLQLVPDWKVCDYLHTDSQKLKIKEMGFTDEDLNKTYNQLSIGQQVRLKVMLFLYQPASVYLLDEPTHALDEFNRKKLIEFLMIQASQKLILIATHDQALIEKSTIEFKMQSAFKTLINYHQHSSTISFDKQKQYDVNPWKRWFHKLEKIHRSGFIGGMISFAIWIIQIALFLSINFTFQIQHQMNQYQQMVMSDPWLEVVETQTIPIHESPFQLVKNAYPNQESFSILFQDSINTRWLIDISDWFPKTIELNSVMVKIRFVDLPFDDQHISTAWIFPKETLPDSLTLTSTPLPNLTNTLTFSGPIRPLYHRNPSSWFEPAQLLLSYWQWLGILTHQETLIQEKISNYLDAYLMLLPPSHALIFNPNQKQKNILISLSGHPWRFTIPTEKAYPLIIPLMKPLLNFLPFLTSCLLLLWVVLWWSRLHWIYHEHHRHWQWMIVLNQSFKKIWFHVTYHVQLRSMFLHGVTLSGLVMLFSYQNFFPIPPMMVILIIQISIWIILENLKLMIRGLFNYA